MCKIVTFRTAVLTAKPKSLFRNIGKKTKQGMTYSLFKGRNYRVGLLHLGEGATPRVKDFKFLKL